MLRISRSSFRYRSVAADDSALRLRIREITEIRVHYGYRRVHILLRREGWRDNHKRIYRLYREQGLSLRSKDRIATNQHNAASHSLRGCIQTMSGAWILSLMPCLTAAGCVC
ncbi:IS2 transposase TnpB [Dickeya solani]|uniref:Transposase protein n=1 Tax=Dickeya solani D s0432-1 TaxID=1231725 RepID=A0AAV3KEP4_9GAMM|nr:IS2 transposase TnpB [Dickeya solani]ERO59008.1 Transposase protein [Dickeya solani D s0432-1]AYQ52196.1 IS2 transposase TnpB [Dickeya solani]MBD3605557.1 IS3 family transposase [Dickeya solani]MBJ2330428.1 transposase [Dickeya solani]